jgi:hypothetical protein
MAFVRGKCRTEQLCVQSWYKNWSCEQRERFLCVLRQEQAVGVVSPEDLLLATFQNIDLSGRLLYRYLAFQS